MIQTENFNLSPNKSIFFFQILKRKKDKNESGKENRKYIFPVTLYFKFYSENFLFLFLKREKEKLNYELFFFQLAFFYSLNFYFQQKNFFCLISRKTENGKRNGKRIKRAPHKLIG